MTPEQRRALITGGAGREITHLATYSTTNGGGRVCVCRCGWMSAVHYDGKEGIEYREHLRPTAAEVTP